MLTNYGTLGLIMLAVIAVGIVPDPSERFEKQAYDSRTMRGREFVGSEFDAFSGQPCLFSGGEPQRERECGDEERGKRGDGAVILASEVSRAIEVEPYSRSRTIDTGMTILKGLVSFFILLLVVAGVKRL